MIEASNNTAASMAIHGIKGSVKKLLQPLIDDLMDIIAQIEVILIILNMKMSNN